MTRSQFVTHWTGKDIQTSAAELTDAERVRYVSRLIDTIEKGLWMSVPLEELYGWAPNGETAHITHRAPMTCFTELRLSGSAIHTRRYGLLGFVFTRNFVLDRAGGPVHYVRSHRDDPVIGNLSQVLSWVDDQRSRGTDFAKEVADALFFNIGLMKAMSTPSSDDFAYLDEHEWRIIHNDLQQSAGRLVATGTTAPPYRIPFDSNHLRMVVLPDQVVRQMVLRDERLGRWLAERPPPLLTADELSEL